MSLDDSKEGIRGGTRKDPDFSEGYSAKSRPRNTF
jgi:hypothetical protein